MANTLFGPAAVVNGVIGLHGSDDAKLRKAREIFRTHMLGVFDAPPAVAARAVLLGNFRVNIQHDAIGFVADGMNGDLQTGLVGAQRHLQHVPFGQHHFVGQA